jgi:hypothetical protein
VGPDAAFAAKFAALSAVSSDAIIILIDSTGDEAASAAAALLASEDLSLQKVFYVKVRCALACCGCDVLALVLPARPCRP